MVERTWEVWPFSSCCTISWRRWVVLDDSVVVAGWTERRRRRVKRFMVVKGGSRVHVPREQFRNFSLHVPWVHVSRYT